MPTRASFGSTEHYTEADMASVNYNELKRQLLEAWSSGKTIRVALIMAGSTVPTENATVTYVDDFTTLNEGDATDYARLTAQNVTVTRNDVQNRGQLTFDDLSFQNLGGDASAAYIGILLIDYVAGATPDTVSRVIQYLEFSNGELSEQATQIDIPISADDGVIRIT
jgi:hypothetical protein